MKSRTLAEAFARMAPHKGGLPFSFSRAQSLGRCTWQFEQLYRKGKRPRGTPLENDDTVVGKAAHRILECTVKDSNATGIMTAAGGSFETHFQEVFGGLSTSAQRLALAKVKEPMAVALSEIYRRAAQGGHVMIPERKIVFYADGTHKPTMNGAGWGKWSSSGSTGLVGYVDLEMKSGGELLVYDYKTEFPSDLRRESVELQMGLYAFCELEARPSVDVVKTHVVYLKNHETDLVATYERGESLEALRSRLVSWFDWYVSALENFEPKRTRNAYCKYCDVADQCGAAMET